MRPVPALHTLTIDGFLDWVEVQGAPFEWDGTAAAPILGNTLAHSELASRVEQALRTGLRGGPCRVLRFGLGLRTAGGTRMRFPDIAVTCGPIQRQAREIPDPVLIVEVLSEGTAAIDRGVKRIEYAALPSLARYVMLAPDARVAVICDRAGGFEERQEHSVLDLPEFGLTLPLAALYAGLLD